MVTTAVLLATLAAGTSGNAQLDRAEKLCDELQFAACLSALDAAWAVEENPRPTVLRILELQGITAASLGQQPRAQAALRQLFVIAPDHPVRRDYAPRVMTQVFEARAWANSKGALQLEELTPEIDGGLIRSVGVRVASDPLTMVRGVRLHLRAGAGEWATQLVPLSGDHAKAPAAVRELAWFAEVLGERNRVLATIGDAKDPRVARAAPEAVAESASPVADAAAPAAANVAANTSSSPGFYRPASYVLGGLAVLSVAGGTYFGLSANEARTRLAAPTLNEQGRVTGLTQLEADSLNKTMQRDATLANGLFVAGGILAGAGVTFFLLGDDVQATPAPGGVTVHGSFD